MISLCLMPQPQFQHSAGTTGSTKTDIEASRCIVCDGAYAPSRLLGLVECTNCSFVSADVNISDEQLTLLYRKEYFHGQEYLDYVAEEESLRLNFRNRIAILRALIPNLSACDLFEIGCAYGFFL